MDFLDFSERAFGLFSISATMDEQKGRHVSLRSGLKVRVDENEVYCYFLPFINWFALFILS